MKKLSERDFNGTLVKYYDLEQDKIEPIGFIEGLIQSGVQVSSIDVQEDVEFDMKMDTGRYTLETLKQRYPHILEMRFPTLYDINGKYNDCNVCITIKSDSKVAYLTSDSPGLELTDIVEKKTENLDQTLMV